MVDVMLLLLRAMNSTVDVMFPLPPPCDDQYGGCDAPPPCDEQYGGCDLPPPPPPPCADQYGGCDLPPPSPPCDDQY
ncbi:hypothetical protein MPER_15699, partial [Moniliophthora perniciosa FA553]